MWIAGIEPATNHLEGDRSTQTELYPLVYWTIHRFVYTLRSPTGLSFSAQDRHTEPEPLSKQINLNTLEPYV